MDQKLLQLLQKSKTSKQLKETHLQITINGLWNSNFIVPKLLTFSSNLISLKYTLDVFRSLQYPNLVSYNTLIKCFIGKTLKSALYTYNQMRVSNITPNSFTFTFLLRCFESFDALQCGEVLHSEILKLGFGSSVFAKNTLMDFYAKCGNLGLARKVFDEMPERDVVSWNTMIGAYTIHGNQEYAIFLFEAMPERNLVSWNSVIAGLLKAGNMELARSVFKRMPEKSDVSWNTMISGYVKLGDVENARAIFDEMPEKSIISWTAMVSGYAMRGDLQSARKMFDRMPEKNVVSWNAMIAGYVNNHMFDEALSVFQHMLIDGNYKPNQTTLISVLSACSHLASQEHGKWVDSFIRKNKFDLSVPLGNALIDTFAKCGDMENAKAVFLRMGQRCIITWTTMISGLAVNGHCREAVELYGQMSLEVVEPDDVVFIAVLSACTHGGLLEEGKRVFYQMVNKFGIKPRIEHYGCMVDLLGRAGKFEEALSFIKSMHLEPNRVIWATLLSACKTYRNGELLESLTRRILEQEPNNPSYLTLIMNLSSSIGRWQDALNFRVATRDQGIVKTPGCSSIQIGNNVHEFLAKDTKHPQRKEIYRVLGCLNGHLKLCEVE
ncbi:pentatricopeptide repeat-containing protein At2g29760, chloroplastic [Capsicum annuum]|uniref:pentatricopeptide repeat-containing protein At2g29760, chloroplastic n=1 Tax=Capsicum annuum TaxID=4072 RepID=UPI001FB17B02|nr:pentatricopeptide repeat-containing protein At2g29760, chloroplastic [Capsicum annuum]XP_047266314.1 pentatricopeptide repeat-containing protein At2g29760, chloroplastic [Capsicum annuum]XP_047266315.1 pentatricopeptide repeat-containing protein At2g29760, chloroplastic [Capsicum annuum]XP_047266316.1 pentatricopeptide repeat-containing protein At2g29760, chloroplastic [Capsicum annuum]XP_047266317.1 pentatricopeptide repeat-containing protein At2g29760, chloroplastic [Capsicum annuum]XP_04